jgi:hypothetical protein
VFDLYLTLECFSCTQSSSRRGVFTCTLRLDVSLVLSQALDEVRLTCTLRYDASLVLSQALDEVCSFVPYVRMFHGYLVKL